MLGNYLVIPETARTPNLRVGFGLQGIGTGNPGYFATSEKGFIVSGARVSAYLGVGFRSNEAHGHFLGGLKVTPPGHWTFGVQQDGHDTHPFAIVGLDRNWSAWLYLVETKSPGLMISYAVR